jgi:cation transport regulator ChaC
MEGDAVVMSPIWVFKYGSLILNPGITDDARVVGFIGDYQIRLPLYVSVRDLVVRDGCGRHPSEREIGFNLFL